MNEKQCLLFSVTIPADADAWSYISVLFGYTPFVWLAFVFLRFVWKRRDTRQLSYLFQILFSFGVNEILKALINQDRPPGACGKSSGMPSSHAAMAVGSLTAVTLDLISTTTFTTRSSNKSSSNKSKSKEEWKKIMIWMALVVLLLPVPVSRVVLGDHTKEQALAGSFSGLVTGIVWFLGMIKVREYTVSALGKNVLGTFVVHNYAPIAYELIDKVSGSEAVTEKEAVEESKITTTYGSVV